MEIEIIEHRYHRNGVAGQGFHAFRFWWEYDNGERARFIATIFSSQDSEGRECETPNGLVCVLTELPYAGVSISETWRGEYVEPTLRKFLAWRDRNRKPTTMEAPTVEMYYANRKRRQGASV